MYKYTAHITSLLLFVSFHEANTANNFRRFRRPFAGV